MVPAVGWPLIGASVLIGIAIFLFNIRYENQPSFKKRSPGMVFMVTGAVIYLIGCVIFYFHDSKAEAQNLTWKIGIISPAQSGKIAKEIFKIQSRPINLSSISTAGTEIRERLSSSFRERSVNYFAGGSFLPTFTMDGIYISPNDEQSKKISDIIKRNTDFPVTVGKSPRSPNMAVTEIIIGSRPIENLPESLLTEAKATGEAMVALSLDIGNFAEDREKESAKIRMTTVTQEEAAAGKIPESFIEMKRVNDETSALFGNRYGVRCATLVDKLGNMGIFQPFFMSRGASDSRPKVIALWFNMIGTLLSNKDIKQARDLSFNNQYWMSRM